MNRSSKLMLSAGILSPASPPLSASSDALLLSMPSAGVRDWTCRRIVMQFRWQVGIHRSKLEQISAFLCLAFESRDIRITDTSQRQCGHKLEGARAMVLEICSFTYSALCAAQFAPLNAVHCVHPAWQSANLRGQQAGVAEPMEEGAPADGVHVTPSAAAIQDALRHTMGASSAQVLQLIICVRAFA